MTILTLKLHHKKSYKINISSSRVFCLTGFEILLTHIFQKILMSSYIIAGSADSTDTAYCEQIARIIKAKYKNIDFRIVIKHPSQWEEYLQQICRIYGFLNKSNPIVYTFDGKIIGNKDSFMATASKYFGIEENNLIVPNISNKINMKLAQAQIAQKKIVKNNIKTLNEKIQTSYQNLLNKKCLKKSLVQKNQFLSNGIQYQYREVAGLCKNMVFAKEKKVQVVPEQIKPEEIDLMALSLHDQVRLDDGTNKEAFVTANNQAQDQRMSEVSRTNKLHQSMVSYDKDSKGVKQSSSKLKSRIDEEFDDIPDFVDIDMHQYAVCELIENFYLAFDKNAYIEGEMIFYLNQDSNGNIMRVYNDGRPVKGHHSQINAVLPQIQQIEQQKEQWLQVEKQQQQQQKKQEQEKKQNVQQPKQTQKQQVTPTGQQSPKINTEPAENLKVQNEEKNNFNGKSKTEPNQIEQQPEVQQQSPSEIHLQYCLTHHTLYYLKPLALLQLKALLNLLTQSQTIACLQFIPENPNPKVKLYHRKLLTGTEKGLLPIQMYIQKQIEQEQFDILSLAYLKQQKEQLQKKEVQLKQIRQMNFTNYYFQHNLANLNEELLSKVIRAVVNQIVNLEGKIKKQTGFNLIITKKYTMIVPIIEPYRIYNNQKLYLDALSYLGLVSIAKVAQPYKIGATNQQLTPEMVKYFLAKCSGFQNE